ncbi:M1 family metallopeptidase [Microbacterium oxydans]|uniref:Aminopeptidase N n=1 Tax=Microbacterium oxydans TaxID=82380 RepID=A0A0F0LK99_9MICO|nr:M1 family metallopeptidase [Microbacterium oxydans]KJL33119.1 Aminopeptidase N [Microbacterium oxydans]
MLRLTSPARRRLLATLPVTTLLAGSLLVTSIPASAADGPIDGPRTAGDAMFPNVGNGGYDALDYDVSLAWSPTGVASGLITGDITTATTTMTARALSPLRSFSLDFEGMTISQVTVNGAPATWERDIDAEAIKYKLIVTPATPVEGEFTVAVTYSGTPEVHYDADGSSEGWNGTNDGAILLGQPIGMMAGFPHNNTPGDKATYTISVDAPSVLANASGVTGTAAVASNGELQSKTVAGDRTTWVWRQDKQMASELAVIAIGRFDVIEGSITLADGRSIPSWSFMDSGLSDGNKTTIRNRVAQLETITRNLESMYGAYPGNSTGVIVDSVPSGVNYALETQDRSFFPSAGSVNGNTLIHELVHQWYGDNVAPTTWTDIWIGEGMATWGPTHYNSAAGFGSGTSTEQTYYNSWNRTASTSANWETPPGAQTDSATLYDYQTYTRGAQFWEALKISIGDDAFFALIKEWQTRFAGQSRTGADLKALAEELSGRDITALWNDWILEPGKPAWPDKLSLTLTDAAADPLAIGDTVTYTVSAANTGLVPLASSVVTVDLSQLLTRATLDAVPAGATLDGNTLTWTVPVGTAPAAAANLAFSATVIDDAPGGAFSVTAAVATLGGTCITCIAEANVMEVLAPTTAPTITGKANVGETLTASSEGWPEGTELSYAWAIDGEPVVSAARAADPATTFTIPASALGSRISVTVTGSLAGFRTGSATSAATAAVGAAIVPGDGDGTPGTGGVGDPDDEQLSSTGGEFPIGGMLLGLMLLSAGGAVVAMRRRRSIDAS